MEKVVVYLREYWPQFYYWLYGLKTRKYRHLSPQQIFTEKYLSNSWDDQESCSGPGSNLENTRIIRSEIPELLRSLDVRTMLDIPCGDDYWISKLDLDLDLYVGADIVEQLIDTNRRKFGNKKRLFFCIDITKDQLPRTDLILCRDCLVHFSFSDIFLALQQINLSKSKYLLTTTYTEKQKNIDIVTGQWRPINLEKEPFNFPKPIQLIVEQSSEQAGYSADKCLGLWEISDVIVQKMVGCE